MGAIFLSYAREDRRFAETAAQVLEDAGHSVWWDRRIDGGEEFGLEIEAALDAADVVLVAWSKDSVKSRWVRDEASVGGDRGRLVPVSIDGSRPAIGFRQFHTIDLSGWKGAKRDSRTAELLHSIERRLGHKGDAPPPPPEKADHRRIAFGRRGLWVAAIAVALLAVGAYFLTTEKPTESSSPPSVGILPFTGVQADPETVRLAAATRDAIAHTLSQGAFAVRMIDALPKGGEAPADFVISAQVSGTSGKIVTTVRLEEIAHQVVLFSHQFEAERAKASELPEQIGAQIASQLSWTAPLIELERKHPSDPAVVATLLQSSPPGLGGGGELHDYAAARRLAASAPKSPLAQSQFAFNTAFAIFQLPAGQRAEALAAAREAAERSIELAPDYGSAYVPWCLLHSDQRLAECEERLRKGMRLGPDDPFVNWFLSRLLNNVGRNAEAMELARLSLAHDRYMPYKIGQMLRMLEATGQTKEAADLYKQSGPWWPKNDTLAWYRSSGMVLRGDYDAVRRFWDETGLGDPSSIIPALAAALRNPSAPDVRRVCRPQTKDLDAIACMLSLAQAGDFDEAYRFADRLYPSGIGRDAADEDRIWLEHQQAATLMFLTSPAAAALRRDPRYLQLAHRTGLLAYWRKGHKPDFCASRPEPICASLFKRS